MCNLTVPLVDCQENTDAVKGFPNVKIWLCPLRSNIFDTPKLKMDIMDIKGLCNWRSETEGIG